MSDLTGAPGQLGRHQEGAAVVAFAALDGTLPDCEEGPKISGKF